MKRPICLLIALLTVFSVFAQRYPQGYFTAPVDTPLILKGTFGEVRDGHFHSGIDISTGEQEGVSVRAAADGYVSRIKVSASGFGRVLYVTHPNGYVTVYAHLQKFRDDLREYMRSEQLKQKSYEIELFPKKGEFKVTKGQEIALSGNSGNSQGPHLHFEIRDEKSEDPLNPLLFGLPVEDHQPPVLRALRVYPELEGGMVETTDTARSYNIFPWDTLYGVETGEYIKVYGICSVGFDVYDKQEGSDAELGIHSAELYIDGIKTYQWINNRLDFDDTRYANAHSDYEVRKRDGVHMERCYRMSGNHFLPIYPDTGLTGIFEFTGDDSHDLRFLAHDFYGNTCNITFQLQSYSPLANKPYQTHPEGALLVTPAKGIAVHHDNLDVIIPSGAVYEPMYYYDDELPNRRGLSNTYYVGNPYEALHVPITVSIKPAAAVSDSLKSKVLMARLEPDGSLIGQGGAWNKEFLTAKTREFGRYFLALDTVAPTVTKEYYPADLNTSRGGIVQLIVKDDLSGLKTYSPVIDGQWQLAEFDAKTGLLTIDLSGLTLNQQHQIELTVTDERGNTQVWKDGFWW